MDNIPFFYPFSMALPVYQKLPDIIISHSLCFFKFLFVIFFTLLIFNIAYSLFNVTV